MTKYEFLSECGKRLIDPLIALENENLKNALSKDYDYKVIEILDNEF